MTRGYLLVFVFVWLSACVDELEPGLWFAGDLHVHSRGASNDVSNGGGFPDEIKSLALERGLDFVVLTDHSNATGSGEESATEDPLLFNQGPEFVHHDESERLSDENFVMVTGSELSPYDEENLEARGHIGCLPAAGLDHDKEAPFIDRPSGVINGADALSQAEARDCFSVVNHPYSSVATWIEYDWSSFDYDALEVWNGGLRFDEADEHALDAFICDRLQGRQVTMVGGSDSHRLTDAVESPLTTPLAFPKTHVFAEERTWKSLHAGLSAGRVVISDFDIFVDVKVLKGDAPVALPGDALDWSANLSLHIEANTSIDSALRVLFYDVESCVDDLRGSPDASPPVAQAERLAYEVLNVDEDNSYTIELNESLRGGLVFVRLDSAGANGHALVAPILIR